MLNSPTKERESSTVLPETWSLLTDAFFTIEPISIGFQQYPDLNRMSEEHLDDFLDKSPLTSLQKTDLKASSDKIEMYSRIKLGYDLNKAIDVYNNFHATLSKNGIFIVDTLKVQFAEIDQMLKDVIIERQVTLHSQGQFQPTKSDKRLTLHSHGRLLLKALEQNVQARLWSSQDTGNE